MKTKRRNAFSIMASLITLIGSFSFVMMLAIINGTIGNLLGNGVLIFASLGVAKIMDPALITLSWPWIISLTILSGVLKGLLKYIEQYSNHFIAFKILAILRDKIFKKLRELAPANLLDKKKGSIVALVTSDIETLEVFYAHTISPIAIAFLTSLFMFIFVGSVSNYALAGILLCGYFVIGVIIPLISSKIYSTSGVEYRQNFSQFNSSYLDYIKGRDEIVLNSKEEEFKNTVNSDTKSLLNLNKKIKVKSGYLRALTNLTVTLTILGVLFTGLGLIDKGVIPAASLAIVVISISASFGPTSALAALPQNLTQTLASGDRLLNLMKEKPIVSEVSGKNDFKFENLEVTNLKFDYDTKSVLKDVSFSVSQGEIVGLQGESGSGKSTILNLLLRFFNVNSNMIKYNGIDINEINTASLRKNVTMVSQNTYLFKDTILNNLKIANQNATLEEVKEACKKASIDTFIESLPDKYDTQISEAAENISAGEKQRLGLARAFLRKSPLILLDEPTSNVDSLNEGIILKSLKEASKDHSIILVSHRKSSLSICDKIYHMEDGKVVD